MTVAWVAVGSAVVGAYTGNQATKAAASANRDSTAAAANAAADSEQTARDRLSFDMKAYEDGAADRAFATNMARKTASDQDEDRDKYNALQDEQIVRGRQFQNVEDQILADAVDYDTEANRTQLAGQATASVNQAFANVKGQANRDRDRAGVNRSAGRAQASDDQMRIAQAAGMSGAANSARTQATTTALARKMDAVGLGKGLVGNQSVQAGLQLQSGNSAVNNSLQPINIANNANGLMSSAYGNASTAYNNSSNTFANVAGLQSKNFYGAQKYGTGVGNATSSALMGLAGNFGLKAS